MEQITNLLVERRKYLQKIISTKKTKLEGLHGKQSVYTIGHRNSFQYYLKDEQGTHYLKAQDRGIAQKIVQGEYNSKMLLAAERELKKIDELLKIYNKKPIEKIYGSMPVGKKKLVIPDILPDAEYRQKWLDQTYEPLGFRENAPEYTSARGERMRSKSEVIIANLLDKLHIDYKYEKPLMLKQLGLVHPDFTLLHLKRRKEIYLEHLGMLDDQVYRNNAIMKLRAYENSGYYIGDTVIITEETFSCPLDIKVVEKKIKYIMEL